jgi:tRNA nucleotidyltransferase/poly(A) polymerase
MEDLKKYLKQYFDIFKPLGVYSWVAGGVVRDFLRQDDSKDVDFYFKSEKDKESASEFLKKSGYNLTHSWSHHYTFQKDGLTLDVSHRENNPSDCISKFDYTISACAVDSDFNLYFHDDFLKDLERDKLVRISQTDRIIITNIKMLNRFLKKGYTIDNENLIKYLDDQENTSN